MAVAEKPGEVITPFVLINDTGRSLFVRFDETLEVSCKNLASSMYLRMFLRGFCLQPPPDARNRVAKMTADAIIPVRNSSEYEVTISERSIMELSQDPRSRIVHVIVRHYNVKQGCQDMFASTVLIGLDGGLEGDARGSNLEGRTASVQHQRHGLPQRTLADDDDRIVQLRHEDAHHAVHLRRTSLTRVCNVT